VVVLDGASGMPACKAETALCAEAQRLPAGCYQWLTWKVRFL
jgi:hypothetical protein